MNQYLAIIAIGLTFVGYIPYVINVLKGNTKPHAYTWFIWGLVSAIACGVQISEGAGVAAFPFLAAALVCTFIFVLALKRGHDHITFSDKVFLILAATALVLWLYAQQPILSMVLLLVVDLLGLAPTLRKSWSRPYEETAISFACNTVRFGLIVLAVENSTFITIFYPLFWMMVNGAFVAFLLVRRSKVNTPTPKRRK